jgi:hypothetical protein
MGHFLLLCQQYCPLLVASGPRSLLASWSQSGIRSLHGFTKDPTCFQEIPEVYVLNWPAISTLSEDWLAFKAKSRVGDPFPGFSNIYCCATNDPQT